jgi:hypothetical protein
MLIDDEFEAAHVTAIDLFWLRRIAIVPDLGLAGRTLPGHREINGGTKGALSLINLTEGAWTQSRDTNCRREKAPLGVDRDSTLCYWTRMVWVQRELAVESRTSTQDGGIHRDTVAHFRLGHFKLDHYPRSVVSQSG